MVHVSGFYEDQIMKKTQEQGSPIREQQPLAAQVNTKVLDKQPVPSKEGASSKERLHTDSPFDSSITTTPFSVSIPMSAGSLNGKEDFEETINEIDREIQRFDLPHTNENAPTASPQNLTKDKLASIQFCDPSLKPISKGPPFNTFKLSPTHNIERQAKWTYRPRK